MLLSPTIHEYKQPKNSNIHVPKCKLESNTCATVILYFS